jgi:hypothetical protein
LHKIHFPRACLKAQSNGKIFKARSLIGQCRDISDISLGGCHRKMRERMEY